jgi:hypothetical protein
MLTSALREPAESPTGHGEATSMPPKVYPGARAEPGSTDGSSADTTKALSRYCWSSKASRSLIARVCVDSTRARRRARRTFDEILLSARADVRRALEQRAVRTNRLAKLTCSAPGRRRLYAQKHAAISRLLALSVVSVDHMDLIAGNLGITLDDGRRLHVPIAGLSQEARSRVLAVLYDRVKQYSGDRVDTDLTSHHPHDLAVTANPQLPRET